MKKQSLAEFFKENIGYIFSGIVVLVYIITALVTLTKTGKTVDQILVDGFIILALGVTLSNTLGQQGFIEGEKHPDYKEAKRIHQEKVNENQEIMPDSDLYCAFKNKQALRSERERLLNTSSLAYADYFTEEGKFIGALKEKPAEGPKTTLQLIEQQNHAIMRAVNLQITQITPSDLITESAKVNDPLARGRSKKAYTQSMLIMELVWKVSSALLGGLYTARLLAENRAELIYRSVLAFILLGFAIFKYYANYRYILTENVERIETSTQWIEEFRTMHKKGLLKRPDKPKPVPEPITVPEPGKAPEPIKAADHTPAAAVENKPEGTLTASPGIAGIIPGTAIMILPNTRK